MSESPTDPAHPRAARREFHADEFSARTLGSGASLARALARLESVARAAPTDVPPATAHLFIVNPLGAVGGLASPFRIHPPTEARIRPLEAMR